MRVLKFCALILVVLVALALGAFSTRAYLDTNSNARVKPESSRESLTERAILDLQNALAQNPYRADAWARLGAAFLQRVRENGDPANYTRAEQAFQKSLARDEKNFDAISGMGTLALARHQFRDARAWGERARALNPDSAAVYGILGDAHLELGEYTAAFENFQTMVNTRPDLASYARVAYAREIVGDRAGAIENMQRAVNAGAPQTEARAWALTQLGNLYFGGGNFSDARAAYQAALENWSAYPYARAGLAQGYAAQKNYADAIETYTRVLETFPLPEFVIALGDVYEASGDTANAQKQYALVGAMQQLFQANGVDTDAELALFNADHQIDLNNTLELAKRAYEKRPNLFVADTLAWTYYQTGDYENARTYIEQALKLSTQNALLFFHAGMIYEQAGDTPRAKHFLDAALKLNPRFSVRYADAAAKELTALNRE